MGMKNHALCNFRFFEKITVTIKTNQMEKKILVYLIDVQRGIRVIWKFAYISSNEYLKRFPF